MPIHYVLSMVAFMLQWQSWAIVTKIVCGPQNKVFTIWHYTKSFPTSGGGFFNLLKIGIVSYQISFWYVHIIEKFLLLKNQVVFMDFILFIFLVCNHSFVYTVNNPNQNFKWEVAVIASGDKQRNYFLVYILYHYVVSLYFYKLAFKVPIIASTCFSIKFWWKIITNSHFPLFSLFL